MKIVFFNPPFIGRFSRAQRSPGITKSGTLYYPIWLAYAAGWAERCGHQIQIIDAPADGSDIDVSLQRISSFNPGLLVMQTTTPTIDHDGDIARQLKKRMPELFVVMVGTHVSALPEQTLQCYRSVDAVARGEFEDTVAELASALETQKNFSSVAGLSFRIGERIINNPDRQFTEDLDRYPFVSQVYKCHLNIRDYFFAASRYPMVQIFTSRGCPARCFFCVYPQTFHGHKLRVRSAENVVAEFEFIKREMPEVKEIVIEDDTFTADEERARRICRLLIEKKIDAVWNANARVTLTLETMLLMKRAGCRLLIPGYESGNQDVLNGMKKGIRLEQSRQFARNAQKAGLMVHGCFLVGGPNETKQTMEETFKFALELDPDTAQFFPIMAYPGTAAYTWADSAGFIKAKSFRDWNNGEGGHNSIVTRPELTAEELVRFCNRARDRFYLRPSYLAKRAVQSVLNPAERQRLWRGFKTLSKHLLHASTS